MRKHTGLTALLTCLALVLVLGAGVKPSLSYFTTYVTAEGGYDIRLHKVETEVTEKYDGGTKEITVQNIGEADCYVRARAFAGSLVKLTCHGDGWADGEDGYYYYREVLEPGETAEKLYVDIEYTGDKNHKQDYNVIVVEECAPILLDENGVLYDNTPSYPGWSLRAEVGSDEG